MIGIISLDYNHSQDDERSPDVLLPGNLQDASNWKFTTTSVDPSTYSSFAQHHGLKSGVIYQRVRNICTHLKEGIAYLNSQEKALHEIANAVQSIGQLVHKRDAGKFPRIPEANLEAEFQLLLQQITASRNLSHFNKPLFGNSGSAPLRIHTSLSDVPRYEEVRVADLESLHLRMIYWGKVAGDGTKALVSREIVDFALTHLFEVTIQCQKQKHRLQHVYQQMAECLTTPEEVNEPLQSEGISPELKADEATPGILHSIKEKLLNLKGSIGK